MDDVPVAPGDARPEAPPEKLFEVVVGHGVERGERRLPTAALAPEHLPDARNPALDRRAVERREALRGLARLEDVLLVSHLGHEVTVDDLRERAPVRPPDQRNAL